GRGALPRRLTRSPPDRSDRSAVRLELPLCGPRWEVRLARPEPCERFGWQPAGARPERSGREGRPCRTGHGRPGEPRGGADPPLTGRNAQLLRAGAEAEAEPGAGDGDWYSFHRHSGHASGPAARDRLRRVVRLGPLPHAELPVSDVGSGLREMAPRSGRSEPMRLRLTQGEA